MNEELRIEKNLSNKREDNYLQIKMKEDLRIEKNSSNKIEDSFISFLKNDQLVFEVSDRKETIETLKESQNFEVVNDYLIVKDFKLKTEGANITLAYKEGDNRILVVKEMEEKRMNELASLNQWGELTVEEYLKSKKFNDPNVLLPIDIIKKDGKIYRFYEAMDIDLEKYLETHNRFSIKDGISLILHASQGVESLNKVGVANIDFAPLNIMLTKTSLKLIDLDGASIDKDGSGLFSRNYLGNNRFTAAPELLEERPSFDKTVDVYSVSANLYRLIVGDWPYNIEKETKLLPYEEKMSAYKQIHKSGNIIFPNNIPLEIQRIIKKGMDPLPKNRYQSIKEFSLDLFEVYNNLKLDSIK